jgi:hypothetical protein
MSALAQILNRNLYYSVKDDRHNKECSVMFRYCFYVLAGAAMLTHSLAGKEQTGNDMNQTKSANIVSLRAQVGAYYFESADLDATARMLSEFPGRAPIWGWHNHSHKVMEQQIDLAADNGITFFAFDWYWHDNGRAINTQKIKQDRLHTGLNLYLKAKNHRRLKFCLLVANHQGFEINGPEAWNQAADFWMPYFKDPQYLLVDGKPLVIIFNRKGGNKAGLPGVAIAGCWEGPREIGYTHLTHYNAIPHWEEGLEEHKFQELVEYHESLWTGTKEQPYIPCVVSGWDRRPREDPKLSNQKYCWYYPDRTPEAFQAHLQKAVDWMDKHPDQTTAERIVVLYDCNELGEGGYIIPTNGDPEGSYLNAVRSVVMPGQ